MRTLIFHVGTWLWLQTDTKGLQDKNNLKLQQAPAKWYYICAHVHVCTYMYTYMHTHTYTCMHTTNIIVIESTFKKLKSICHHLFLGWYNIWILKLTTFPVGKDIFILLSSVELYFLVLSDLSRFESLIFLYKIDILPWIFDSFHPSFRALLVNRSSLLKEAGFSVYLKGLVVFFCLNVVLVLSLLPFLPSVFLAEPLLKQPSLQHRFESQVQSRTVSLLAQCIFSVVEMQCGLKEWS